MGLPRSNDSEARFSSYVEGLTSVIGHADRAKPLRDYCLGLMMMPCERKSVEPMAAITAPERTAAQHQSLLHFLPVRGDAVLVRDYHGQRRTVTVAPDGFNWQGTTYASLSAIALGKILEYLHHCRH